MFPTFREQMEPVLQLVRDQVAEDYDYPTKIAALRGRHRSGVGRDPARARGRGARADARGERGQPPDGAAHARPPLLHRPGRQRARAARAHRDRREARGAGRPRRTRRRDPPPLQRAAGVHRRPERASTGGRSWRRPGGTRARLRRSSPATGSGRSPRRSSPSRTSPTGASPTSSTAARRPTPADHGRRGLAGRRRGHRARRPAREAEFDAVQTGDVLVCQMTNPAWQVLFSRIAGS